MCTLNNWAIFFADIVGETIPSQKLWTSLKAAPSSSAGLHNATLPRKKEPQESSRSRTRRSLGDQNVANPSGRRNGEGLSVGALFPLLARHILHNITNRDECVKNRGLTDPDGVIATCAIQMHDTIHVDPTRPLSLALHTAKKGNGYEVTYFSRISSLFIPLAMLVMEFL